MRYAVLLLVVGLLISSLAYADVPKMINFQGRLTDASGKFVADGNYSLTFRIYTDSTGGSAKWTEAQSVAASKGLFNVILGSNTPIPDSIFNYPNTWLSIQVASDPEMTPRQRFSSLGYSYRTAKADTSSYSMNSDKLDGFHASDFSSIGTDYGRSGVATDLYEGTSTLFSKYVHKIGPDSVIATSGTAFRGHSSDTAAFDVVGLRGEASNYGTGTAYALSGNAGTFDRGDVYGGYFQGVAIGTGVSYGVFGGGSGSSSSAVYGSYGSGYNISTGTVYGGYFNATNYGTGTHYGVYGLGGGSSSSYVFGSSGYGDNTSTGTVYGGLFGASSNGTGTHYGVYGSSEGSSSNTVYGSYGFGRSYSTGTVYGGYFQAINEGTGTKYGVYAIAPTSQGYAGYFAGNTLATGTKTAAVKVNNGEYRLLYSQESPENWFEDFGEGSLVNGRAVISLDPLFIQTVNTNVTYHVFLTPGGDCNGLYVVNKTPGSFEVRELKSGNSNLTFSYRIVAKRKGYENLRLAKMGGPTPEEVALEQAKHQAEMEKERARMDKEQEKMTEERVKMEKLEER